MRDLTQLFYAIAAFISGFFGMYLSNKKTNHSNLDDENDRLSKRNLALTDMIEKKDKKIDDLRGKLNRKEEQYIKQEATIADQRRLIDSLKGDKSDETKHKND